MRGPIDRIASGPEHGAEQAHQAVLFLDLADEGAPKFEQPTQLRLPVIKEAVAKSVGDLLVLGCCRTGKRSVPWATCCLRG